MSTVISVAADLLVAVLLAATIATSLRLSRRIRGFKADEQALRRTIVDLTAATDTAERAISGLRGTLADCERALAERLRQAGSFDAELTARIRAGQAVMERVGSIAELSRRAADATGRERVERADGAERADSLTATREALDEIVRRVASRRLEERAA